VDGGLGVSSHRPRCLKDLFYDVFGLNESDDGHRPLALGTRQRIDFIDFFCISLAQFLRYPLDGSSGCKMEGTNPSSFAFFR
jgi:hypothetical protein